MTCGTSIDRCTSTRYTSSSHNVKEVIETGSETLSDNSYYCLEMICIDRSDPIQSNPMDEEEVEGHLE